MTEGVKFMHESNAADSELCWCQKPSNPLIRTLFSNICTG